MNLYPLDGNPAYDLWRESLEVVRLGTGEKILDPASAAAEELADVAGPLWTDYRDELGPRVLAALEDAASFDPICAARLAEWRRHPSRPGSLARDAVRALYSFAIPTDRALDRLAAFSPDGVVEIGAGSGYWSALLARRGVDVVAYDARPPGSHEGSGEVRWYEAGCAYHEVRYGIAADAARHPERTLLLCWPYMDRMAADAADAHHAAGGTRLAYIGEGWGGCTADDDFHALIDEPYEGPDRRTHKTVDTVALPQWPGIHDWLRLCERLG